MAALENMPSQGVFPVGEGQELLVQGRSRHVLLLALRQLQHDRQLASSSDQRERVVERTTQPRVLEEQRRVYESHS